MDGVLNGHLGFENVFATFMNSGNEFETIKRVGINGYVSVCGTYIDMWMVLGAVAVALDNIINNGHDGNIGE